MIRFLPTLLIAAAGTTALGSILVQPQDGGDRPVTQDRPATAQSEPGQDKSKSEANTVLATWLLVENKVEVELSRIAEQKAHNAEVKEFARSMVQAHQQYGQKLQRFAGSVELGGRGSLSSTGGQTGQSGQTREAGARPSEMSPGFDHVALIQELGTQCLETGRKVLQEKQGAEFDHCYMVMAIGQHMKTHDMMTVFERHASGELEQLIQEGKTAVQQHLERGKQLAETTLKPNAK